MDFAFTKISLYRAHKDNDRRLLAESDYLPDQTIDQLT